MLSTAFFTYLNFQKFHFFSQKRPKTSTKKHLQEILPFYAHSTSNWPPFPDFEKNRALKK